MQRSSGTASLLRWSWPGSRWFPQFPAHSILLSNSAVLWCRVLRWQDAQPCTRASKRARTGSSSSDNASSMQPVTRYRLALELQDASEQQAALAVLQSLYAVKPLPELLSELSQEQLLQAAVLADKWQVPHVSKAAAQLLEGAAGNPGALAEAVQQRMLSAVALPDCLQPLLKIVLLSLFCDLEAVWADAGLQAQLLRLPLHSMELLLSCYELRVGSEDTVLYTARRYTSALELGQQTRAKRRLACLIRCPLLSRFWLSGVANSAQADDMLLAELRPQIRRLLLLRDVYSEYSINAADIQEGGRLADAPPSWALGRRIIRPVASVQLVWKLKVSKLRDAARRSATEQLATHVASPLSPPLGGINFGATFRCTAQDGGSQVGLYFGPKNVPSDMFYRGTFKVNVEGRESTAYAGVNQVRCGNQGFYWQDCFGLGAMANGWNEVAWVIKGLPTSGHLTIKLEVSKVPHAVERRW